MGSKRVSEDVEDELGVFICSMYGDHRNNKVDKLRLVKMKEKCNDKTAATLRNIDLENQPSDKR